MYFGAVKNIRENIGLLRISDGLLLSHLTHLTSKSALDNIEMHAIVRTDRKTMNTIDIAD